MDTDFLMQSGVGGEYWLPKAHHHDSRVVDSVTSLSQAVLSIAVLTFCHLTEDSIPEKMTPEKAAMIAKKDGDEVLKYLASIIGRPEQFRYISSFRSGFIDAVYAAKSSAPAPTNVGAGGSAQHDGVSFQSEGVSTGSAQREAVSFQSEGGSTDSALQQSTSVIRTTGSTLQRVALFLLGFVLIFASIGLFVIAQDHTDAVPSVVFLAMFFLLSVLLLFVGQTVQGKFRFFFGRVLPLVFCFGAMFVWFSLLTRPVEGNMVLSVMSTTGHHLTDLAPVTEKEVGPLFKWQDTDRKLYRRVNLLDEQIVVNFPRTVTVQLALPHGTKASIEVEVEVTKYGDAVALYKNAKGLQAKLQSVLVTTALQMDKGFSDLEKELANVPTCEVSLTGSSFESALENVEKVCRPLFEKKREEAQPRVRAAFSEVFATFLLSEADLAKEGAPAEDGTENQSGRKFPYLKLKLVQEEEPVKKELQTTPQTIKPKKQGGGSKGREHFVFYENTKRRRQIPGVSKSIFAHSRFKEKIISAHKSFSRSIINDVLIFSQFFSPVL